jgi:uncharacterized membrane protein
MKVVVALVLVAAAACGKKTAPSVPAGTTVIPGPARMRGTLLARDSALALVACGTVVERAVTTLPAAQLRDALVSVVGAEGDSMYVEFLADTTGDRLLARETLFASSLAEGSGCDRPRYPYDFEALGTEPFWHVTLDSTQLVLERPERPLELVFVADPPVTRGTLTTITAHRTEGRVRDLTLRLLRDACRDKMSDSWYPLRAEVRFGDAALRGCARR